MTGSFAADLRAGYGALVIAALAMMAGCATVPIVPELPAESDNAQTIQVHDTRGRLSQREATAVLKRLATQVPNASALDRHLAIEQSVAGSPLYTGNRATLLRDGGQSFAAVFSALHRARHYLLLEYYILEDVTFQSEKLSDLLIERAHEGVQIDVLYDGIGSLSTPRDFFTRLTGAGIRVREFNPINPLGAHFSLNDRDHRKLLVCDGDQAIIGGVNLSSDYQSSPSGSAPDAGSGGSVSGSHREQPGDPAIHEAWHDLDVEIDGPAVRELRALFGQHWTQQGGSSSDLPTDDSAAGAQGNQIVRILGSRAGQLTPRYYATLLSAIRSASSRVWITAAYFVPTLQERQALRRAAGRGVDVELLLPSHSDSSAALAVQHSYYSLLLQSGVKIFERQDGILHSKVMVADGVWSIIGSSNFDHRSVLFNDEVDAVILGPETGASLEGFFQQDLRTAHAIDADSWRRRPWSARLRERFWRLWESLL